MKIKVNELLRNDLDSLKVEFKALEGELDNLDVKVLKGSLF